jgi:hypothetical protein
VRFQVPAPPPDLFVGYVLVPLIELFKSAGGASGQAFNSLHLLDDMVITLIEPDGGSVRLPFWLHFQYRLVLILTNSYADMCTPLAAGAPRADTKRVRPASPAARGRLASSESVHHGICPVRDM